MESGTERAWPWFGEATRACDQAFQASISCFLQSSALASICIRFIKPAMNTEPEQTF
jgi:hypothetical protein